MAFSFALLVVLYTGCREDKLPIIGYQEIVDGKPTFAKIPEFSYQNQDGQTIRSVDLKGKIHIANFFFTSCPTICPKTVRSMVEIAKYFGNDPRIQYINFSIDYRRDSVPRLKAYYDRLGVDLPNFHLLRIPDREELRRVPQKYLSIATENPEAAGGFDHSGWLLLVDQELHLRAFCLGTDEKAVKKFIQDVRRLLDE